MRSAWKLHALGVLVGAALAGCGSMNLKWWSRSSEPASVPAEPLRELPASQPAETTATEVAEAAASQPAAQADAADPQAVDPEVAPLDAQVQAFTGRVAAAGEARHPRVEPSVPESDSTAGPAVESPADPPASQPAVAQGPAGPRDAEPPAARGPQPAAAEESSPTIFGPEPEKPAKPPAEAATGETEATMSGGRTTSIVLPAEPVRASATPVPTAAVVGPPADRPAAPLNVEIVEVRPVVAPPAASDSAAAVNPANQPADPDTALGGVDLKTIIEKLERDMERRPPHPDDQIRLRLLYIAAGMPQRATGPIDGMDPVQGELLSAVLQTVASARQAILEPTEANPTALTAAEELRRLLGQQAGVIIPRICLVTRVSSFGDYEAITPLRFKAGQPIQAYVYTEVANYHSEPTEDGRLRTLLSEKIEVFSRDGKLVWQRTEAGIEDRVRTPRRDFFVPFPIRLPATLPAGEYVLKATIEDRIGGTTDQQRLTFSIHD